MKKILLFIFTLFFLVSTFGIASADYIVNTGEGTSDTSLSLYRGDYGFQYQGGQFTIAAGYKANITSVEGYMYGVDSQTSPDLTIAIYGNESYTHPYPSVEKERPDTSNEIYTMSFIGPNINEGKDWYGLDSLSWDLDAGTYWVAFEVRVGQTFNGSMPINVANPIPNAYYANGNPDWYYNLYSDIGFRIEGTVTEVGTVPEPATMLLFGIGLLGLAGVNRKK